MLLSYGSSLSWFTGFFLAHLLRSFVLKQGEECLSGRTFCFVFFSFIVYFYPSYHVSLDRTRHVRILEFSFPKT